MAVMPERRTKPPMPPQGSPLIDSVLWYAEVLGWPIFPLAPASKAPLFKSPHDPGDPCRGECGKVGHGLHDATTHLETLRAWWGACPTANIGFALPAWLIAVDVDNGEKKHGLEAFARLEAEHGSLPVSVTNFTGSGNGSKHILLRVPEGVSLRGTLGEDIDIKKQGGYLVLPPSKHPDTGQEYSWKTGPDAQDYGPEKGEPQPAPLWLMTLLQTAGSANNGNGSPRDPDVLIDHHRNVYLTSQAGKLRALGFDGAEIYAALTVRNTQRCSPPLAEKEVKSLSYGMERYSPEAELIVTTRTVPLGFPSRAIPLTAANEPVVPSPTDWMKDLFIYAKSGELKQNAFNIGQILRNHPFWHMPERTLWYDVIRGYHMCGKEQISKSLCTRATQWFGGQMRLAISNIELLKLCMEAEAAEHHIDLLEQHLLELHTWDRVKRLDTWLHDVTGADDNDYTRYLSRALPVSMVARVLAPGCPCRLVVILEGKENIGKSHLVEAIATSEWYTILSMSLEGKDSHIMLHKYWIAELAELDSLSRTEEARMKAFVTMETDTYVPKYSNVAVSIPRRTIFMGTTNDASGYLKGQSGNTRYFPLKVGDRIDVDKFRLLRGQIFAEAMVWHSEHHESWWNEPAEVTALANEARELRRQASDYEQPLHEWLEYTRFDPGHYEEGYNETGQLVRKKVEFAPSETSWPEIARWFLKIDAPERWKDRSLQLQIASSLKALGWISAPVWRFGRTTRIWMLPEPGSEG